MYNIRLLLLVSFSLVLALLYQAWQKDYAAKESPAVVQNTTDTTPVPAAPLPQTAEPKVANEAHLVDKQDSLHDYRYVRVITDVLDVRISLQGGSLVSSHLRQYPADKGVSNDGFQLFKDSPNHIFIAQSGLIGNSGGLPDHQALFTSQADSYSLQEGQNEIRVTLTWESNPVKVNKIFVFKRGAYLVDVYHEIINSGKESIAARFYAQFVRTPPLKEEESSFVYTYTGPALYSPQTKYEKIAFDKIQKESLSREVSDGWVAMLQHYFMAAWIPERQETYNFYTGASSHNRYIIGMWSPVKTVLPDHTQVLPSKIYFGPKLQEVIGNITQGLELTVDYGLLTVFAQPLFWLLSKLYVLVSNWGVAIILLTIIIKIIFYKLSEASYKSMAHMRQVMPRIQALKDRYGEDRQKLNQAMMELYKKEKINPLGGCLPIVVQIPVFIALYWVLLESVEMRNAPFVLWIDNLSVPDAYYVLPLLMGITMFIQQKLNPTPIDPVQAKVMMSLPFVFTVFFAFFPSGLVLYWFVNNLLSIIQQWLIVKRIEGASAK